MPSRQTTAVVLTADLKRQLRETAARQDRSVSAVVRQALRLYFLGSNGTHSNGGSEVASRTPEAEVA